jgi:hypothetical protein
MLHGEDKHNVNIVEGSNMASDDMVPINNVGGC